MISWLRTLIGLTALDSRLAEQEAALISLVMRLHRLEQHLEAPTTRPARPKATDPHLGAA